MWPCQSLRRSATSGTSHISLAQRCLWWNCRRAEDDLKRVNESSRDRRVTLLAQPALRSLTPSKKKKTNQKNSFVTCCVSSRGNYLASCWCILVLLEDWYQRLQPLLFPSASPSVCCSLTSQMLCISSYFAFPLSNANLEGTARQQKEKKYIIKRYHSATSLPTL